MAAGRLSGRQVGVLQEMGIDVWQLRDVDAPPPLVGDADVDIATTPSGNQVQHAPANNRDDKLPEEWQVVHGAIRGCNRCELHQTRTQAVCGVGNAQADWLIVGEAPGADEDRQGEPFVGRAGQLLNEMLRAIGMQREQVFIANVLKCRPPNNRDPRPTEIEQCLPYLQRQIELLQPKVILVVGRIAAQTLLQVDAPLGKLRGQRHEYGGVPLVVTYHPAYLLRSPTNKSKSWADLLLAMDLMAEQS